jgi:hypothetical protein
MRFESRLRSEGIMPVGSSHSIMRTVSERVGAGVRRLLYPRGIAP